MLPTRLSRCLVATACFALLGLGSGAHAQPGPPVVPTPPSTKGPDVRTNPLAYHVPEAWRDKARTFVDPGGMGLAGGYVLQDIRLGHDIRATFQGPKGSLVVRIIPARVATADDAWRGQRVALRVEQSDAAASKAIAHLQRQLSQRESGWGWLRRDPNKEDKDASTRDGRKALVQARRLIATGRKAEGLKAVQAALEQASGDVFAHITAARILYQGGHPSLGKLRAEAVLATARKGQSVEGLSDALQARTTLHVARTMALADVPDEASELGQGVAAGPYGCEAVDLAHDLRLTNATGVAMALGNAIVAAAPACDAAQAFRVDVLRRTDKAAEALKLAESLVQARTGLTATRSAWAHVALESGDLTTATRQASVPVERGGATGDSIIVLAAVLAAGGAEHAPFPRWANQLERNPTTANRGLGAAAHFVRNEYDKAIEQLVAIETANPDAVGLKAMRAVVLARAGKLDEAKAALEAAWESDVAIIWAVAAEAELAEAEARIPDAISIWEAYVTQRKRALGPLTLAQVESRLAALKRGQPASTSVEPTRQPSTAPSADARTSTQRDEKDRIPTWVLYVVVILGVLGLYLWRRTRPS